MDTPLDEILYALKGFQRDSGHPPEVAGSEPLPGPGALVDLHQAGGKCLLQLQGWDKKQQGVGREHVHVVGSALLDTLDVVHPWLQYLQEALGGGDTGSAAPEFRHLHQLHRKLHGLYARCAVATRLLEFRRQTGRSLRYLAAEVGINHAQLGLLEKAGVGLPRGETQEVLLELLGMPRPGIASPDGQAVEGPQEGERHAAMRLLRKRTDTLPPQAIRVLAEIAGTLGPLADEPT